MDLSFMDFYHSLQMASPKVDFQPTATEMTFHRKKLNQSILKSKMEYQSQGGHSPELIFSYI